MICEQFSKDEWDKKCCMLSSPKCNGLGIWVENKIKYINRHHYFGVVEGTLRWYWSHLDPDQAIYKACYCSGKDFKMEIKQRAYL